jgi:DNA-binding protein HU-beta
MNKQGLVEKVQGVLGGTKVDAEKAVDTVFETITSELSGGNDVSVAGFGAFSANMRKARTARNPRTGEAIQVPAMRVPKFKAAKALKDAVKK